MTEPPMPPAGASGNDEGLPGNDPARAAQESATRPFEEPVNAEQEQLTGMATPDPDKGAP